MGVIGQPMLDHVIVRTESLPGRGQPPRVAAERMPLAVRAAHYVGFAIFALCGGLMLAASSYYQAPIAGRVRHPWHAWLKPSGTIGQALGVLALSLFLFLWIYPFRKKLGRWGQRIGSVPRWLDVHIVAGLLVPLVAAVHAGWRFQGLIGLGYLSMFIVCLSGVIGRYLYVHIPRGRNGVELTMEEVASERRVLLDELASQVNVPAAEVERRLMPKTDARPTANPIAVLTRMIRDDLARRRAVGAFCSGLGLPRAALAPAMKLARRELALRQQALMLEAIQRVFRHWHAAHRPFAITALIAVCAHVIVAVRMGQTWFW
jgi:hypothetical protein